MIHNTEAKQLKRQYPETNNALIFNIDRMASLQQMADVMSTAKVTVPKHLQGSPGDCLAIIIQSAQWQMNPYAVAQKTHLVNGALGYEAQLVNAVVSSSSLLASRISYEFEGDWKSINGKSNSEDHAVTVSATLRGESAPKTLRVAMSQVGIVRNSPLWASDPRQQLAYLATKKWTRLYAPDVLLGVYTPDELADSAIQAERNMGDADVVHVKDLYDDNGIAQRKQDRERESENKTPEVVSVPDILATIKAAVTMEDLNDVSYNAAKLDINTDGYKNVRAAWIAKREKIGIAEYKKRPDYSETEEAEGTK